jgi:hypothetical protein
METIALHPHRELTEKERFMVGCLRRLVKDESDTPLWSDPKLVEALDIAMWMWIVCSPTTEDIDSLDGLCASWPIYRPMVLWGAVNVLTATYTQSWTREGDVFVLPDDEGTVPLATGYKILRLERDSEERFGRFLDAKEQVPRYLS